MHAKLKWRSPGLLAAAFIGAALMTVLNLIVNYNNHYVAPVVPANPVRDYKSLHLDQSIFNQTLTVDKGFSLFDGDVENNPLTQEFVQKLSYSFMSSIVFGMPTYDRTTGIKLESQAMQPILSFITEIEGSRLNRMVTFVETLFNVVACAGETVAPNPEALNIAPAYESYVDVFQPEALDLVILLHKTMILVDIFTLEHLDTWRAAQRKCLFVESSPLNLYLCAITELSSLVNAITDCLNWPRLPLTLFEEANIADYQIKSAERRELMSAKIGSSAWTDLHQTLTFSGESVMHILSKILTPSGQGRSGLGYTVWSDRLERLLIGLQNSAIEHCRYTICQLPLLIWPYVISAVRDFLKLVWLDVSNIALLFVLTAVVGCTGLEAAFSFGDLRQVTSFYHCHSQHYWLRSIADSVILAVPAFVLGSVVSASLRIKADNLWVSSLTSGAIATLGAVSATALTTAIASMMRDKVKSILASAVMLSLFLLLSGFLLKEENSNVVFRFLGYMSMFQYTFKGLVKNAYAHAADQQVGVMSNEFTLRFVGGIDPQDLLTVPQMMLVLTGQIVLYRLLGWFIFRSVHKTHSAMVER